MTEIPSVWLWVSGIYFVLQSILVLCLIMGLFRALHMMKEIAPKVEAISAKVTEIGDKVEDLTVTMKDTMEVVGGRAKSVAGSADLIAKTAANTFERFSPAVVGILSGLKILRAVMEFRDSRKAASEKGPAKGLAKVDKRAHK